MRWLLLAMFVASCGDNHTSKPDASGDDGYIEVALVRAVPNRNLDLLFLIDDSVNLEWESYLKVAFPVFLAELGAAGMPGLHIGVVTSDLGTKGVDDAEPGPSVGSGPGSCSGDGKAGRLVTNGSQMISGTFISDVDGTKNYSGTLSDAFAQIASVGAGGCGFEQSLEAIRRSMTNPTNAGFLRDDAGLGIFVLTDEDDCSFKTSALLGSDVATLGPLQSFRCTRFGVRCDDGGATPDEMNVPGSKAGCHSNESSPYLVPVATYTAFLRSMKADPRTMRFAALAGLPPEVAVELRTGPGGGTPIPALRHACAHQSVNGVAVADPAVRISQLASSLRMSTVDSGCSERYDDALVAYARQLRNVMGDACMTSDVDPARCNVFDERLDSEAELPACSESQSTDCYRFVADPACTTERQLRVEVVRSVDPDPSTMVSVRCR